MDKKKALFPHVHVTPRIGHPPPLSIITSIRILHNSGQRLQERQDPQRNHNSKHAPPHHVPPLLRHPRRSRLRPRRGALAEPRRAGTAGRAGSRATTRAAVRAGAAT